MLAAWIHLHRLCHKLDGSFEIICFGIGDRKCSYVAVIRPVRQFTCLRRVCDGLCSVTKRWIATRGPQPGSAIEDQTEVGVNLDSFGIVRECLGVVPAFGIRIPSIAVSVFKIGSSQN